MLVSDRYRSSGSWTLKSVMPILINFARLCWLLALIIIFWFACIPAPPELMSSFNDKITHFLVFFFLGISAFFLWPNKKGERQVLFFLAFYGAFIEVVQYYVPGRTLSLFDWIMDIAGLIVAFGLIKFKPATFKIYRV